jgi:hypothetical protein
MIVRKHFAKELLVMNRHQLYNVVVYFAALVAFVNVANAQSKDRDKPTRLTSNELSGLIDDETRGNFYYYSFMASPGEVTITLTVEPGRRVNDSVGLTSVGFSVFDRNAEEVAKKYVSTSEKGGAGQGVARFDVTRPQLMTLSINIPGGDIYKSVGGRYRVRIAGAIDIKQDAPSSKEPDCEETFAEKMESVRVSDKLKELLPKSGILYVTLKDGSIKSFDLRQVAGVEVTVCPITGLPKP